MLCTRNTITLFKVEYEVAEWNRVAITWYFISQWSRYKDAYVIYRTLTFLFHWGWLIAGWVLAKPDHYYTLTNWSVFFTGLYYLISFIASIYGIVVKKDYKGPKTDPAIVSGSSTEKGWSCMAVSQWVAITFHFSFCIFSGNLLLLHKITWFLHVVSTTLALYVTLIYWISVAPGQTPEQIRAPIGQYKHSVQLGLILIDFFVVAIPSRWLHFVYSQLLGLAYSIMTVIIHFTGVTSAIYNFLNFNNNPGLAIGVLIVATLIAPIIFHSVYFGLYHLRAFIYRRTVGLKEENVASSELPEARSHDNPAFSVS